MQLINTGILQRRNQILLNHTGQLFHQSGLSDTGLTNQQRICLILARQYGNHKIQLRIPSHDILIRSAHIQIAKLTDFIQLAHTAMLHLQQHHLFIHIIAMQYLRCHTAVCLQQCQCQGIHIHHCILFSGRQ